ncbi:MAG: DUF4412 domain-containing protein [Aureispira sp.]|nr:DUF4412 domain-containing protein [Aureispira sp.]
MKITRLFILLLLGIGANSTIQAQIFEKVADKVTKSVEKSVERRAGQEADKATDKALDKVFSPKKSKTNTKKEPSTTNSDNTEPKPIESTKVEETKKPKEKVTINKLDENEFVGSFRVEIKKFKKNKPVKDGHAILDYFFDTYDIAIHQFDGDNPKERKAAIILLRQSQASVIISEEEKKAIKTRLSRELLTPKPEPKKEDVYITRTSETKNIDTYNCVKYLVEKDNEFSELWVDETTKVDLHKMNRTLQSIFGKNLNKTSYETTQEIKGLVRDATTTNNSKKEKTHMKLSYYDDENPGRKPFDYSDYEVIDGF